ncbi:MAG: TIGR02587 family membrane protein [Caulobacterales bacterium]
MSENAKYARGLGRAFVGAALFALPLFMTMEMWTLGVAMQPARIFAMLLAFLPVLVALSYFAGFERAFGVTDHLLDAFAAIAVAAISTIIVLVLFGVIKPGITLEEAAGTIAILTLPSAIGALLADKQLGDEDAADVDARSYGAKLFLMAVGGLFVALNVAPTEEMMLIAHQISPWQAILVVLGSLGVLHALLFVADLPGRQERRGDRHALSVFVRYSLAGYALCALISAGLLWCFGRLDGVSLFEGVEFVIVLSFPAALGAGVAQSLIGEKRAGG